MKAWLVKWQISAALDAGRPPWRWLRHWAGRHQDLRTIEPELISLDRALRESVPQSPAPEALHQSIMRAVRASKRPPVSCRVAPSRWWLWAPGLAVVLVGAWLVSPWAMRPPASSAPAMESAVGVFVAGQQIAAAAPQAVVAPLSDELDRLKSDLQNTAQFLLASVP